MNQVLIDPATYPDSTTGGIQEAVDALPKSGGLIMLSADTFHLRRCIRLKANVTLRGAGAATILARPAPVVERLAADTPPNATTLHLRDTSGFRPGDQVFLCDRKLGGWNSRHLVLSGVEKGKLHGACLYGLPKFRYTTANDAWVGNYFPAVWAPDAHHGAVESLCIDGGEFSYDRLPRADFAAAAIHVNAAESFRIRDVTVRRWPTDGISLQRGSGIVTGCIVEDCLGIGMHPGTNLKQSLWTGNISRRNGSGFYFCLGCVNTICAHNLFLDNKGCGIHGLADPDRFNVVLGNICAGNGETGIEAGAARGNLISANLCRENSQQAPGIHPGILLRRHRDNLATGNVCLDDRAAPTQLRGIEALGPIGNNLIADNYSSGGMLIEERNPGRDDDAVRAFLELPGNTGQSGAALKGWGRPVFHDDCGSRKISGNWSVETAFGGAPFKRVGDMMTGQQRIWSRRGFSGRALRIEHDVLSISETGATGPHTMAKNPDGSFELIVLLGFRHNSVSGIQINREFVTPLKPGSILRARTRQRVAVELGAGRISVWVDNCRLLDYQGPQAPKALKNYRVGLFSPVPGIYFGHVRVYVRH